MAWPMDAQAKITGHYMLYWRVPSNVYVHKQPGLPDIAIIEYGPKENRPGWILATNGASQYRVRSQNKLIGCELFGRFQNNSPENRDLMTKLARYPVTYREPLFTFDTISLDNHSIASNIPYPHLLFGGSLYDPETLGAIQFDAHNLINSNQFDAQNIVIVNQAFGIYDAELEYSKRFGGEALWNKMAAAKISDALDVNRPSLV